MIPISIPRRPLAGLALLLFQSLVFAADRTTPPAAHSQAEKTPLSLLSSSHDPMAMTSLWQLTLGMLLVLSLILAIAWLLKRSGRFQAGAGGLRILGGLSMGSRERVVLIQAGDTQLLLGVAPGRVQTLHVLDEPLQPQRVAPGSGFAEQLARLITREKSS